jgi:hyaluronate lyase
MDRVVHRRPTFGFGISMSSHRIANYESIDGENLHGWYTGDGMSYLYNSELWQFSSDFWATINPYRLPGTTVDTQQRTDASGERHLNNADWVGGAAIPNSTLGAVGMQLLAWNSTLEAWKSWFCLDDTIITPGSLTSNDNRTIETIVENRRLSDANSEALIVNGTTQSSTLGWSATLQGVNWIHLSSTGGYYFPGGATLNMLREARTGTWHDINQGGSRTPVTRNYATIWFDHDINPSGTTYAYQDIVEQFARESALTGTAGYYVPSEEMQHIIVGL